MKLLINVDVQDDLGGCGVEGCGNSARYLTFGISSDGTQRVALTCGVCPVKYGLESIRMSDVARFMFAAISLVRPVVADVPDVLEAIDTMRSILGRRPE